MIDQDTFFVLSLMNLLVSMALSPLSWKYDDLDLRMTGSRSVLMESGTFPDGYLGVQADF